MRNTRLNPLTQEPVNGDFASYIEALQSQSLRSMRKGNVSGSIFPESNFAIDIEKSRSGMVVVNSRQEREEAQQIRNAQAAMVIEKVRALGVGVLGWVLICVGITCVSLSITFGDDFGEMWMPVAMLSLFFGLICTSKAAQDRQRRKKAAANLSSS